MLWKDLLSSLAVTVLLAPGFFGSAARAAQTSGLVPAQVTFADAPGDRVLSDSYGPTYQDGQLGVSCDFHDPALGGSGDLTFHTISNSPPVQLRWLNFLFGTPLAPCVIDPGGTVPASSQQASLTVRQIYQLPVSSTPVTTAALFFLAEGQLQYGWPGYCSTSVQVIHPDQKTWIISANPAPAASGAGDLAVFVQPVRHQGVPTNYWDLPFTITATPLQ